MKTLFISAVFALLAQGALAAPATHVAGKSVTVPATVSRTSGTMASHAPRDAKEFRTPSGNGWTALAEQKEALPEVDCTLPRSKDERKACEAAAK